MYTTPAEKLTSDLAIRIRIPASMQTPRIAPKMHHRQPLALEMTPIHPVVIILLAFVAAARGLDLGDLQLDLDQSNGYKQDISNSTPSYVHFLRGQ